MAALLYEGLIMTPRNDNIIFNGNMGGNLDSGPIDISYFDLASFQAIWTGTPVGIMKIRISNADPNGGPPNDAQFSDYTSTITPINNAGDFMFNIYPCAYNWAKLVYTRTSGSGTLNVRTNRKAP